jgi:hypothetical protein
MLNCGSDVYHTYPFPFGIAMIHSVFYAGGKYHYMAADQFVSEGTMEVYQCLLFARKHPDGHICQTCAKVCRNLTVHGFCCDWEERDGLNVTGREEFNEWIESNVGKKSNAITGIQGSDGESFGKTIGNSNQKREFPEKTNRFNQYCARVGKMFRVWV